MRRVKCSRFTIRLWFDAEGLGDRDALLIGFKSRVESLLPSNGPEEVAALAENFFDEHDKVAALEVLSAATSNGVVHYYEWP